LFLFIIFLSSFTSLSGQRPFVTVWNTNINNDNSKQIRFITEGSFLYSYLNVNNSSISGVGQSEGGDITIDFPQSGNYRLSIVPSSQFYFNSRVNIPNDPEAKKLISVSQWGDVNWHPDLSSMFRSCTNLNIDATDIPDFHNVTNMSSMFAECSNLKTIGSINNWNVQNVTNMSYMFFNCSLFNQPVGNWNVSNVTNMDYLFGFASTFNQSLSNWNVSKVTKMRGMFRDTDIFNQPIENWNVGNVVDMYTMFYNAQSFNQSLQNWNVGKVTNMGGMFVNAKKFNQPIGNWNVSNVTTMEHMFSGALVFNQDLGNWNLKSVNLISNSDGFNSLHNFFDSSGVDCQNYMKTLKGWSENTNTPNNLNFGAGGVRYGLKGKTYRDLFVNTKGWNIVGDLY
ncbi:MAG: BspA family leucine-rich repeat surface protein, partial [Chryseobacterium sp.]